MATRKSTILKCDVCGKEVTDEGSGWIGGHPFSGWYSLKEHGGSTQLVELNRQKDWDICSKGCLMDFSNRAFPVHISSGKGSDIPLSEVRGILSNDQMSGHGPQKEKPMNPNETPERPVVRSIACSAISCPQCHSKEHVYTWTRDIDFDGTHYFGHYCQKDKGGCGKHFDSERDPNELEPGTKLQEGDQVRWDGKWRDVCQNFRLLKELCYLPWPTVTKGIRCRRPNITITDPHPKKD